MVRLCDAFSARDIRTLLVEACSRRSALSRTRLTMSDSYRLQSDVFAMIPSILHSVARDDAVLSLTRTATGTSRSLDFESGVWPS
jgi:hypothetical protein